MALVLSLHVACDVFAPGEAVRVQIIVGNETDAILAAPCLDHAGHAGIHLHLTVPDSGKAIELALPDVLGRPPAASATAEDRLPPGAIRSMWIALHHAVKLAAQGGYSLRAEFISGSDRVLSNTICWYQEGPGVMLVAVPAHRSRSDGAGLWCYRLFRGERMSALYRTDLRWDDTNQVGRISLGAEERMATLGGDARGLVAMSGTRGTARLSEQWVFWLDSDGVRGAIEVLGVQQACCPLPFDAHRIVREATPVEGGGCAVLVTGVDARSIALVRFYQPVVLPPPADDSSPADAELLDHDLAEGAVADLDEDDEPIFPVEMQPPRVAWVHRLEQPFSACALAAGVADHADRRSLAVTVATEAGVEFRYALLTGDEPPGQFHSILIHGRPLPDCPPVLAMDRNGCGHGVLLVTCPDPRGEEQVVVARTSFGRDGRPRLDQGTIYHEQAILAGKPVCGAASLLINDHGGPWVIDWCVLMEDQSCLMSRRYQDPLVMHPGAHISRPLMLLSFDEESVLAAGTQMGELAFIECP